MIIESVRLLLSSIMKIPSVYALKSQVIDL